MVFISTGPPHTMLCRRIIYLLPPLSYVHAPRDAQRLGAYAPAPDRLLDSKRTDWVPVLPEELVRWMLCSRCFSESFSGPAPCSFSFCHSSLCLLYTSPSPRDRG
eukprot:2395462-Rhodomonas_salina.1